MSRLGDRPGVDDRAGNSRTGGRADAMSELQARIQAHIDTLVGTGAETGVQVAIYQDDALIVDAVAGTADPGSGRPLTSEHTDLQLLHGQERGGHARSRARRARSPRLRPPGHGPLARVRRPRQGQGDIATRPDPHGRSSGHATRDHAARPSRLVQGVCVARDRRTALATGIRHGLSRLHLRLPRRSVGSPRDRTSHARAAA